MSFIPQTHPLSASDASTMLALRAQTAAFKGAVFGPDGRAPYDDIMHAVAEPAGIHYQADCVGGVNGYWCLPAQAATDRAILFLHGGGYVMGSARAYCHFAGHFARLSGQAVFVADYRLAPEHPYPAALEDAVAAYQGLQASGRQRLLVMGDSAGGGLTLSLLSRLHTLGHIVQPVAAIAMSPWTDLSNQGDSHRSRHDAELYLSNTMVNACAAMYLGQTAAQDGGASPLYADLHGLPPLQLHVGRDEILLDDSLRYAERASDAGVDVSLHVWDGMPHVFPNTPGLLQAADEALAIMARFINRHLPAL